MFLNITFINIRTHIIKLKDARRDREKTAFLKIYKFFLTL